MVSQVILDLIGLDRSDELFELVIERHEALDNRAMRSRTLVRRVTRPTSERRDFSGIVLGFDPIEWIFLSEGVASNIRRCQENIHAEAGAQRILVNSDTGRPVDLLVRTGSHQAIYFSDHSYES